MERITEVTKDSFAALVQLTRLDPDAQVPADQIHARMKSLIEDVFRRAADAGYSNADAQDMGYAIAALADELALNQSDSFRDQWMGQPLQFHFFQENQAGDGFFTRLQKIRQDPNRMDVLRVYYLCLLFGFQGRYAVRGGDLELLGLTEGLGKELLRGRESSAEMLSPHGDRPGDGLAGARQSATILYWAGGALLTALLIFGGLKLILSTTTTSTIEALGSPLTAQRAP